MAFNKENKITWEELSPSLQELFKGLQTQITKERNERIAADNQLRADLNKEIQDRTKADNDLWDRLKVLAKEIDLARGASFKSWNIRLWENHNIFTDLSFYETHDVQQSGSNNKITDKRYNCIFGMMNDPLNINGPHPGWVKHMETFKGPDGVTRIYCGCGIGIGSATIYRSDEQGLNFDPVQPLAGTAIWDICDASSIGAGLVAVTYGFSLWHSNDGLNWTSVNIPGGAGNAKTLCLFKGKIILVTGGTTYWSTDGVNWNIGSSNNGVGSGHVYSRYYKGARIVIGTEPMLIYASDTNGYNFTLVPWPQSGQGGYVRWICSWKPRGYAPGTDNELILWGTGGADTVERNADLWCADPLDGTVTCLYSFNGWGSNKNQGRTLNYGHAPLEPMVEEPSGSGNFTMAGFREAQIRYIEPFTNDYTGESFLVVGTSDCHFYDNYKNRNLCYQLHNYTNHTSAPLLNDAGQKQFWYPMDKEAWVKTDNTSIGDGAQYPSTMGNVYAISPRNENSFSKNDLCIALIKHTEDTRVYSMTVFTDPQGVKWCYAGTGGGNYSGKGLIYRFGYSDMLNLIEAAKMGAIYPPRWVRRAIDGEGVNPRLVQLMTRSYLKIMGGASARDCFCEFKFAFEQNFLKSSGTNRDPYIKLIANHADTANNYSMTYYPLNNRVVCVDRINNVENYIPIKSQNNNSSYQTKQYELWQTTNPEEGSMAPIMGPFYIMAIKINPGTVNPASTSSVDYWMYDDLDGTVDFYFKKSNNRQDHCSEGDKITTLKINYPAVKKHIGNYGIETFDIKGLEMISMHQMSIARYEKDTMESGEIVFTVS